MNIRIGTVAFVLLVCLGQPAPATDIHAFWDQRCAECHGHAADFARRHLSTQDGKLIGAHHQDDLKMFLGQHHMGPDLVEDIHAMLLAQVQTAPLYQRKCIACHEAASEFARTDLEFRGGVLVGRKTGKPVAEFMKTHGRLTPEEVPAIVEALARVFREVR